jgi:hypothetical protein
MAIEINPEDPGHAGAGAYVDRLLDEGYRIPLLSPYSLTGEENDFLRFGNWEDLLLTALAPDGISVVNLPYYVVEEVKERIKENAVVLQPIKDGWHKVHKGNLLHKQQEDQASESAISLFELVQIMEEVRVSEANAKVFLGLSTRECGDENSIQSIYKSAITSLKERIHTPFDYYDYIAVDAETPVDIAIFQNYYPIPPFFEEGFSLECDFTPARFSEYLIGSGYADSVICIPRIFLWNHLSMKMEIARFIDDFRRNLFDVSYHEFTCDDFKKNGFPVFT